MSKLEFIAAIKWPITVLLLASMATVVLKRNPDARRSFGAWFNRRNVRVHVAGQEFEATVAETQGSMDLAAGPDRELVEAALAPEAPERTPESETDATVEAVRRVAVETTARNAVRLGWLWARGEKGEHEPSVVVTWADDGHPSLRVRPSVRFQRASDLLATQQRMDDDTLTRVSRAIVLAAQTLRPESQREEPPERSA